MSPNNFFDQLKKSTPTVVDELIPGLMKLADVQQVLQNLLREDVPIRQLGLILETLGDHAARIKDPIWLTEYVRHRLARTISHRYRDANTQLRVVTLDPAVEDRIAAGLNTTNAVCTSACRPPRSKPLASRSRNKSASSIKLADRDACW